MLRWGIILMVAGLVAACTSPVYLKHKGTGQVVKCGPYMVGAVSDAMRQSQCIGDYQRQGYERTPSP